MNKNYELIARRVYIYFTILSSINFLLYKCIRKFSIISSKLQYTLSRGETLRVFSAAIFPSNYSHEDLATPYRISLPCAVVYVFTATEPDLACFCVCNIYIYICARARVTGPSLLIFILQVTPENASFDRTLLFSCRDARSCPRVAANSSGLELLRQMQRLEPAK